MTIFVANFAETQPNFVGISQITQKTLQNAENQKNTAKKLEKKMKNSAKILEFEKAALLRDQITELRKNLLDKTK